MCLLCGCLSKADTLQADIDSFLPEDAHFAPHKTVYGKGEGDEKPRCPDRYFCFIAHSDTPPQRPDSRRRPHPQSGRQRYCRSRR